MSIFKKFGNFVGKFAKKVASPVLGIASKVVSGIPFVGPLAGGIIGNLANLVTPHTAQVINSIPPENQQKILAAVQEQGVVKQEKLVETATKYMGVPPTPEQVELLQKATENLTNTPANKPAETSIIQDFVNAFKGGLNINLDTNKPQTDTAGGFMEFITKYWYIFLGGFGMYFLFFKEKSKRWGR